MRGRLAAMLFVAATASCSLEEVALDGKRCPCAVGWVCDPATNRCVEELGGRDAGPDAWSPRDGGAMDARAPDAAMPLDAGAPIDAPGAPPGIDAPPELDAGPPVDAGPDETACDDALAGAMFCDGFEADDDLAAWTMTTGSGATVSRTTARAFRGDASLLAETTTGGGFMQLKHSHAPVTSGELWMRGYMYVPSTSTIAHLDTFFMRSATGPEYHGAVMTLAGALQPFLWISEITSTYAASDALVRDRWTCFEMHVVIGATGTVELYVDGAMVAAGTGIDTSPPGGYGIFAVGITWSAASQAPTQLFFDETAIGRTRLSCD